MSVTVAGGDDAQGEPVTSAESPVPGHGDRTGQSPAADQQCPDDIAADVDAADMGDGN
jgi:hypothetical protein